MGLGIGHPELLKEALEQWAVFDKARRLLPVTGEQYDCTVSEQGMHFVTAKCYNTNLGGTAEEQAFRPNTTKGFFYLYLGSVKI